MSAIPVDVLLAQYLECPDPGRSEALLEQLIVEHAQPGIQRVVRYKLAFQGRNEAQDIEDVSGEVMVELIARLRDMKLGGTAESIGSFSGYTAVAAYHACNEYLRRKYPNRHRLKNRLRYLLNNEKKFAIWEAEGTDWVCGFRKWQMDGAAPAPADRVSHWREVLGDLPHGQNASRPAELLSRVFERLRGPVMFDELVDIMAWLWGVEDPAPVPEARAREIESAESDPGIRMELSKWLNELWAQIRQLPQPQRVALLLNLRAGASSAAITLLPVTGTAGIPEIAETLGFTVDQLAAVWPSLPMEDLAIAERLGLSRQQVINLRKSARERLLRRIGGKYSLAWRY
jgi:RNA polymerase sigma factor (sigma-70 family)